jgi:YHS domain-containing protein
MIAGFIRLVFYFFIAYIIYRVLSFFFSPSQPRRSGQPPQQRSGIMVKDETCNTYLPQEEAIRERVDGKDYFFCSQECRRKFLEQRKSRD